MKQENPLEKKKCWDFLCVNNPCELVNLAYQPAAPTVECNTVFYLKGDL